jgi:deoxyribodipyrimidine photo-lyase
MKTAIWWLRRDLRLDDNPALHAAITAADEVIPIFILDPGLWNSAYAGQARKGFLLASLRSLDKDLRALGSHLIFRQGNPRDALAQLIVETGATAIFAQADISAYACRRDAAVREALSLTLTEGLTIHPLQSVLKKDGQPYTVFTPYSHAWRALASPDAYATIPSPGRIDTPNAIESLPIPTIPAYHAEELFPSGEAAAHECLAAFTQGRDARIFRYETDRDRPDLLGTSMLSPYLRFGVLSPRRAASFVLEARERFPDEARSMSADAWLRQLIWREFYIDILAHFPRVRSESFRTNLADIAWSNAPDEFEAWCSGQSGYPIVDAAMIQLRETGWMHNRARMIVASFLVKDLLIDWRWGERWFLQHLLDGDPAANNGGWQWTAGTGTDAAPYFRVFNPVTQGKKFDPEGRYVRKWLPVLKRVPAMFIHEPWKMPDDVQRDSGCRIGRNYPKPIVDHAWARERALAAYRTAREKSRQEEA